MKELLFRADLKSLWLLGQPVAHSLSPLIQNTALRHLGLPIIYQAAPVRAEQFSQAVHGLLALGALGSNVTVPHKEAAFALCQQPSERARAVGACNALRFVDGRIEGDNTDGSGWWRGLTEAFGERSFSRAVVLGAGGASRSVVERLVRAGVDDLYLLNRTVERAQLLADQLAPGCQVGPLESYPDLLTDNCLLVQTTSAALHQDSNPLPLPERWPRGAVLSELVYGQETPLTGAVRRLGGETQDGLAMLVYQAAESLAWWLARPLPEIPTELMLKTARKSLSA